MKLTAVMPLHPDAVTIKGETGNRQIQLRLGTLRLLLTDDEAIALASQIADRVGELRNARSTA